MEPNKLEQDFKNKLEQRTIEPSQMAWDRLDAMLSVTEEKKRPKKMTWMYMAASFLLFMAAGAFLLNGQQDNEDNDAEATVVNVENTNKGNNTNSVQTPAVKVVDELLMPVKEEAGIAVNKNNSKQLHKAVKQTSIHVMIERTAQNQAVAINEAHQTPVTETEELLASSLDNTKTLKRKPSVKVDAGSLLSSVEGELDNNFRQDMLQKIVKNYNTVKTTVANRNYQYK